MPANAAMGDPVPRSAFGHLLKRLRAARDLTQEELAERGDVSARLISDLERGVIRRPRRDTVQLLADALELTGFDKESFVDLARGRPAMGGAALPKRAGASRRLPLPPTPIIGRQAETARAAALLRRPEICLLTLTGPGGVGKTRLAMEIAATTEAAFADGCWFVDLAPVRDPALVVPTIARVLNVRVGAEASSREVLTEVLHGKRLLLVLDNFEHVATAARDIAELLAACPALKVLATSRRPLHVRAEHDVPMAPLALPDLRAMPALANLADIPAVDLFTRRAAAANGAFVLTADNARDVAEIAVRLDGLPLAIELAAARMRLLSPAALLARLESRLPLLTGGARDSPARQQAMRATIDWSHDLLAPARRRLFRRLAVFAGGCPLEAAEAVAGGANGETVDVLEGLADLVAQSLLQVGDDIDGEPRFNLLETVREYGLEALSASGEEVEARRRHAAWCVSLAERAEPELIGWDQARWFARIELELANLRAALGWTIGRRDAETAQRLAGSVQRFWTTSAHLGEGRRWLEEALAIRGEVPPAVRAKALAVAARIAYFHGDYGSAEVHGDEALRGFRALGDANGIGIALRALALVAEGRGNSAEAIAWYEEALGQFRRIGNRSQVGAVVNDLGMLAWRGGDHKRAESLHEEAVELSREMEDRVGLAAVLCGLSLVAIDGGDVTRAAALAREFVVLQRELGNSRGLLDGLEIFAVIAAERRDDERAARLFGAADALRRRIGVAAVPQDRAYNEPRIDGVRTRLGVAAFVEGWDAGRALSLDEAIALACEG